MKTHLTEEFKKAYDINDLNQCQFLLLRLILEYNAEINEGKIYDHNLKHLLFNTNCVRNPMGFKYSDEDYKKHSQIFTNIIELCNRINNPDIDTSNLFRINLVVDNRIIDDLIGIVIYTYCFYNMNSVNSRRMDDSEVSKLPFAEHLLNIILFYEDQTRILRQNYHKTFSKDMITGLEMSIANRPVEYHENLKISITDNLEAFLESINEILRYLYYQFGKTIKEFASDIDVDKIHPYENVAFEKHLYIAAQRQLLCRLEESIRYGYYKFGRKFKTDDDNNGFAFIIENDEKYKAKHLGVLRREYQIRRYSMTDSRSMQLMTTSQEKIFSLADDLIALQPSNSCFLEINDFHPSLEEFKVAENISKIKAHLVELLTKEYYLNQTVKGVKINDLLTTYYYLNTISEIINSACSKLIKDDDQRTYLKELCIVNISYLVDELSRIYNFEFDYSKKLIDRFVFHEIDNRFDDVFDQPLLKISKTQVVLSSALIDQVNLDRCIERQFIRHKQNISMVGRDFERKILETLKKGYSTSLLDFNYKTIPNFALNENKIEYLAFDGKNIEFDVVAVLGDHIILTELKAVMTSYEVSELETRKENISDAISQLRRRKESIKHDWKKFKEKASLTLPEDPFDEEHIILVACTDTFDFTPLKYDDVYITDDSTYLKYFTNPHVEIIESDIEKTTIKQHMNLWSKGYPTAEEFVNYLIDPVTIHPFADYIEKQFIPIPVMDKDDLIMVCEELMLTDDPIKAEVTKYNK